MYWTTWFLSSFLFHKLIVSQLSICCCYRKTILSQWTKRRPSTLSTSQASPSVIFEKKNGNKWGFFWKIHFRIGQAFENTHYSVHTRLDIQIYFSKKIANISKNIPKIYSFRQDVNFTSRQNFFRPIRFDNSNIFLKSEGCTLFISVFSFALDWVLKEKSTGGNFSAQHKY